MIKKPTELNFENKKFSMIIAGVPGIGKTTLALSSPSPLLIDLDKGVSRVNARYRTDTIEVDSYEELKNDLTRSDLSSYETIVIDTGGKLLEMLKSVVIKEDSKNGKRDGNLSLQGYGAVKRKFKEFIDFVRSLDKHLIIIFHATETSLENDLTGLRIRIEGSSRDEVWDDIDIGGFVEIRGKTRTIGFSNCERYYAKGTHGVHGIFEIEDLANGGKNKFVTNLFNKMKSDLNKEVEDFAKYQKIMSLKVFIEKVNNLEDLNKVWNKVANGEHALTSKDELWICLNNKAKELGGAYDKEQRLFL